MNQKGFANIVLIILVVVLAAGTGYFALVRKPSSVVEQIITPTPTSTQISNFPTPTTIQNSSPTPKVKSNNILSVVDLTGNKEAYLGKRVRVQGRIVINIFYSERKCADNDPVCDTTMGARLELWQPETVSGAENLLLLFVKNQPYPCNKTAPGAYACPPYINNQITTIEGVWSKDQIPTQWIGYSGGKPPIPIKWEDRYFLNVE